MLELAGQKLALEQIARVANGDMPLLTGVRSFAGDIEKIAKLIQRRRVR